MIAEASSQVYCLTREKDVSDFERIVSTSGEMHV